MKIVNLIYYNNGVGLTKDAELLTELLSPICKIQHVILPTTTHYKADINIFIQNVDENSIEYVCMSDTNIMIPNIEWMSSFCLDNIHLFSNIVAKSNECFVQLSKYHKHIINTGFMSVDRFNPTIQKTKRFFHNGGKSIQKNTELVVDVFSQNNLPITIVDSTERFLGKTTENILYIPHFLSNEELNQLYNEHLYHICCSINEGWGHYIYESLSCKSVVLTTNSSPMNEFLTESECFLLNCHEKIDYENSYYARDSFKFPLRKHNYVNKEEFETVVENVYGKDFVQLTDMGRTKFLSINEMFKVKFLSFCKSLLL